jgi:hypothetical protein
MKAPHTTNGLTQVARCSCFVLSARAFLLSALALFSVVAAAEELDIQLSLIARSEHLPTLPPDLQIRAMWPQSCVPVLERTEIDGMRINIYLRASLMRCTDASTPVSFKVNPIIDAGLTDMALGIYEVRIYLSQRGGSSELVAFRLLEAGRDPDAEVESGFWWSVAGEDDINILNGSGLTIEQQGSNLAVTLHTYQAGSPVWYFGSGKLSGPLAHIPLLRMIGGTEPFSATQGKQVAEPGPVLDLAVRGPARADAWLTQSQSGSGLAIEIQRIRITRLPFESAAASTWQGQWILKRSDSREVRLFQFDQAANSDAESIGLNDPIAQASLKCRMTSKTGNALPAFCAITLANEELSAEFDRIGLNRMDGHTHDGHRVELIRLQR